jgi:hypothetical protein
MKAAWIAKFFFLGLVALAAIGGVTMVLWNWLVPDLFQGPELTFWQALGLLALTKILFWSFGKGGYARNRPWGYQWKQKWQSMSPEEREQYKARMKEKWCAWEEKQPNGLNSNV